MTFEMASIHYDMLELDVLNPLMPDGTYKYKKL